MNQCKPIKIKLWLSKQRYFIQDLFNPKVLIYKNMYEFTEKHAK